MAAPQTPFRLLPTDLGLANVVGLDLAPDQRSVMDEILDASTAMSVEAWRIAGASESSFAQQ